MPTIILFMIFIIFCACFYIVFSIKAGKRICFDKKGIFNLSLFIFSLISLCISLGLFWKMGVYVDEYGTSPSVVYGGYFWLYMDWLRLGVLFILCALTGANMFQKR